MRTTIKQCELQFSEHLRTDGVNLNLFATLRTWDYTKPNIMELRFENLIEQPQNLFCDICAFLGILAEGTPPHAPPSRANASHAS